jgi:hypothetical protein
MMTPIDLEGRQVDTGRRRWEEEEEEEDLDTDRDLHPEATGDGKHEVAGEEGEDGVIHHTDRDAPCPGHDQGVRGGHTRDRRRDPGVHRDEEMEDVVVIIGGVTHHRAEMDGEAIGGVRTIAHTTVTVTAVEAGAGAEVKDLHDDSTMVGGRTIALMTDIIGAAVEFVVG